MNYKQLKLRIRKNIDNYTGKKLIQAQRIIEKCKPKSNYNYYNEQQLLFRYE